MKSTPRSWPEEVRQAARSLYLRRSTVGEVSTTLGVPVRTLYNWVEAGRWDDLLSHEGTEEATARRLAVLIEREAKQADDLREIDTLVTTLERLQRLRLRERGLEGVAEREEGKEKAAGSGKEAQKRCVASVRGRLHGGVPQAVLSIPARAAGNPQAPEPLFPQVQTARLYMVFLTGSL